MRFFLLTICLLTTTLRTETRKRRELVRENSLRDLFHSSRDSSSTTLPTKYGNKLSRRRRSGVPPDDEDPDTVPVGEGDCSNPTEDPNRHVEKADWKFTNETRLSISLSWVGNTKGESSTILLLATSEIGFLFSRPSQLYKSTDYGKSFKRVNQEVFGAHIRKNYGIMKNPLNPNKVILVSYNTPFFPTKSTIVKTVDGGVSWRQNRLPFQVSGALLFHPRQQDWILAKSVHNSMAFLSTNFGTTWTMLRKFVHSVKWGARSDKRVEEEEQTILLTMIADQSHGFISIIFGDVHLYRSRNLGKTFEIVAKHVYSFGLQGPFLFVTIDYNKNNRTRVMHVSKNGGNSFEPVMVPAVTPERFYTILDESDGLVFLHVDDPGDTGKGVLYTSDADGIVFSESLRDHVYTNYDQVTDFYKVQSMRGTYIASRMNKDNSVTSLITWDRGGEWQTIPLSDEQCKGVSLEPGEKCSLQIHNQFSKSRNVRFPTGPLSEPNAVGLIIAHAHPGSALKGHVDVWLTDDGGYSWSKVLNGPHHYAIADHGNLIVAVPSSKSTSHYLMFSVNQGRCWFKYRFTEREFHVTGLVTEPGAKTMRFSLWGFSLPVIEWQVITVDFHNVLKQACAGDDYEMWTPHLKNEKNGCLLGKVVQIRRPKKEKLCFNGVDYVPKKVVTPCKCTLADMECDYGYYRKPGTTKCEKDASKPPDLCINGNTATLQGNLGYRRIPGDLCEGGESYDVTTYLEAHQKCKNASWYNYGLNLRDDVTEKTASGKSKKAIVGFIVIPVLVLALVGVLYFARKFWKLSQYKPTYIYSQLSQDDDYLMEDLEGDSFDPRPKGLRRYRDYDSEDDAAMLEI